MNTIYMMIGVPGSGKTTYARKLANEKKCAIVSTDELRKVNKNWSEKKIRTEVYRMCYQIINEQKDVIFDATNIAPSVRKRFVDNMAVYNLEYNLVAYYIYVTRTNCLKRISERNMEYDSVRFSPAVINSYFKKLIPPLCYEGFSDIIVINNDGPKNTEDTFKKHFDIMPYKDVEGFRIYRRTAARSIICEGNKILLIKSKRYGEYKFPGGGVNEGEMLTDTIKREALEEAGVIVKDIKPFCCIEEYRDEVLNTDKYDLFYMLSYYFLANYDGEDTTTVRYLDDYEIEYGYAAEWVNISDAIDTNRKITDPEVCWVQRELRILEIIEEYLKGKKYANIRSYTIEGI